jgi:BMFP domain-containing protein YqiC
MARTVVEIQAALTRAYAAQLTAMDMQSRSIDSGQGRHSVTSANLTEINHTIERLEAELSEATNGANPSISFERDSV